LEKEIKNIRDPFLIKALTMAVDGIEPNTIREAIGTDLEYLDEHGKVNSRVFKSAGEVCPDDRDSGRRFGPDPRGGKLK
jgi:chemotaxis protein MotA